MKQINRVRFESYDCFAIVDTQPGAGNNSLPPEVRCHIVIDHHPARRDLDAGLILINSDIGSSATLLVELLEENKLSMPADLATALTYAINSETQDLGREASHRDVEAYFKVFTKSSMRKLSQIIHPNLPRSYFVAVAKTLHRARSFRNLICAHLGEVTTPDIVAEMADFLMHHERMGWSLCTGRFRDELFLSLRSTNPKARAGRFVKRLIRQCAKFALNNVGGHDMIAGGRIPLQALSKFEVADLETRLSDEFASLLGHGDAEWKPLLAAEEFLEEAWQ